MALIIRIDVDRPYGRRPRFRHVLSRISSDWYLPRMEPFGYLAELKTMLHWLNDQGARAYAFFRRCSLPSRSVLALLDRGRHELGLHLEDSRSFASFTSEKEILEGHIGRKVLAVSKHGSGGGRFGRRHYAPYEPEKYIEWARQSSMKVFFGNLEDPTLQPTAADKEVQCYPSAFWLEPHWRDTGVFTIDWLLACAKDRHVVLLVHPENVLESSALVHDFKRLIGALDTVILK